MNKENVVNLVKMLDMQRKLDERIYQQHGCDYDDTRCHLAMLDEIGELTHEIKSDWCWWKKTQKVKNYEKTLEELVDVWHFALSITYHYLDDAGIDQERHIIDTLEIVKDIEPGIESYWQCVQDIVCSFNEYLICELIELTYSLKFNLADVYGMYMLKNAENFRRQEREY